MIAHVLKAKKNRKKFKKAFANAWTEFVRSFHAWFFSTFRWFREDDGEVAVFDATNTTRKRRRLLYDRMVVDNGYSLFFVESICNNKDIIENNIKEVS